MKNPPAFPRSFSVDDIDPDISYPAHVGMTLRDYFAAKVMQAAITGMATRSEDLIYRECAALAYEMADAMLEARDVK